MSKRFFTFILAVIMCMSMCAVTAFAAEQSTNNTEMAEILNNLPEDANILYQDKEIVVYESNEPVVADNPTMDYACEWVPAGETMGDYPITKTFAGTAHITFKARSDASATTVQMTLFRNSNLTDGVTTATVRANDQDVHVTGTVDAMKNYYVSYQLITTNPEGVFLMTWFYL